MGMLKAKPILEAFGPGKAQDLLHLLRALEQAGIGPEAIRETLEAYIEEKRAAVAAAQKARMANRPRCPECGAPLHLRQIRAPKGPRNRNGYRSCWYCEYGDCTFEHYSTEPIEKETRRSRL